MTTIEQITFGHIGPFNLSFLSEEASTPPTPDNDNWRMMPEWQTPAELLQFIQHLRGKKRRELAADFRLRACPDHRSFWEELIAAEKCARWHFYGER